MGVLNNQKPDGDGGGDGGDDDGDDNIIKEILVMTMVLSNDHGNDSNDDDGDDNDEGDQHHHPIRPSYLDAVTIIQVGIVHQLIHLILVKFPAAQSWRHCHIRTDTTAALVTPHDVCRWGLCTPCCHLVTHYIGGRHTHNTWDNLSTRLVRQKHIIIHILII